MAEDARRFTAVVADDVAALRLLTRIGLEESGRFRIVAEAGDAPSTLNAVREFKPDVLLLDLSMPGESGLQILPALVRESPTTKVVILSGLDRTWMAEQCTTLGAVGYVEKSETGPALARRVLSLIQGA